MNPSPAFTISTVGYAFLKSEVLGTVIFFSIVLASLIAGMVQKLIKSDNYDLLKSQPEKESNISISQLLTESVKSSIGSMLMICAWVILFSCIIKITDITVDNMNIKNFIFAISEVTTGCRALSQKISVPAVAGIISFGGLCTHLQVMPCILKLKLKYKYFLISRIIISSLSTVICQVLLNIIPEAVQTISIGDRPVYSDYSVSLGVTVSVIIMSLLLLIGDNHIAAAKELPTNIQGFELTIWEKIKLLLTENIRLKAYAKLAAYIFLCDGKSPNESKLLEAMIQALQFNPNKEKKFRDQLNTFNSSMPYKQFRKEIRFLFMSRKTITFTWECMAIDKQVSPQEEELFANIVSEYKYLSEAEVTKLKGMATRFARLKPDQIAKEYADLSEERAALRKKISDFIYGILPTWLH